MENEKKKSDFERTNGIYIGKLFQSKGTNKRGEYTRYKVMFKPTPESLKQFSFTLFAPINPNFKGSKSLDDLKEGEQYGILYTEKEAVNKAGQTFDSKTAQAFYLPFKKEEIDASSAGLAKAEAGSSVIDMSSWDKFTEQYFPAIEKNGMKPSPIHMAGSFLVSFAEKERTSGVLAKCKQAVVAYEDAKKAPKEEPKAEV